MAVNGYLSESLPEILQFLDEGSKSGLLAVQPTGAKTTHAAGTAPPQSKPRSGLPFG